MAVTSKILKHKNTILLMRIIVVLITLMIYGHVITNMIDASNATIVYRATSGSGINNPKIRVWNNITGQFNGEIELAASGNPNSPLNHSIIKFSPVSSKRIVVVQDFAGNLTSYISNDGVTWTQTIGIGKVWLTAPATLSRRFDVAFETKSGDAVVVYGVFNSNGALDLAYKEIPRRTLDLSSIGEQYIDDADQSTDVQYSWVALARDPNKSRNDIILVAADSTNTDVKAWAWNGSNWTAENEISTDISDAGMVEVLAAEWAADGSKGMGCSASGASGAINCEYYNGTGVWFTPAA
ncbi:MAG: hypothetical protein AABY07_06735, partial [Nanoarchaeota archaeon]